MSTARATQRNQWCVVGHDRCTIALLTHPGKAIVAEEVKSGANEIKVNLLHKDLVEDDALIFMLDSGTYRVYVDEAGASEGQDADQTYRTIPLKGINRQIPVGTVMRIARDISSAAVKFDYEIRDGVFEGNEDNRITGPDGTPGPTATKIDDGSREKRGLLELVIPRSTTSTMRATLEDTEGKTLENWLKTSLPRLTLDNTDHPYRHELSEETADDKRVSVYQGVLVVSANIATETNDQSGGA